MVTVKPNKDFGKADIEFYCKIYKEEGNQKTLYYTTTEKFYDCETNNFFQVPIKLPEYFSLDAALKVTKPVRDRLRTITMDVCNLIKERFGYITDGVGVVDKGWGHGIVGGSFRVTSKGYVFKCVLSDLTEGGKYGDKLFYGNDKDELVYYIYVDKNSGKLEVYVEAMIGYVAPKGLEEEWSKVNVKNYKYRYLPVPQEILSKIPDLQELVQKCFEEYLFGKVMNLGDKDNYLEYTPRGIEYAIPNHEFGLKQCIEDEVVYFPLVFNGDRSLVYSGTTKDRILRDLEDRYYIFPDTENYTKEQNEEEGYDSTEERLGKGCLFLEDPLDGLDFKDIYLVKDRHIKYVPGVVLVFEDLESTLKTDKEALFFFISQLDKLFMYPNLSDSIKKFFIDNRDGRFSIDSLVNFYIKNDSSGTGWEIVLKGVNGKGDIFVKLPKTDGSSKIAIKVVNIIDRNITTTIPMIVSLGRSFSKLIKGIFGLKVSGKVSEDLKDIEGIYYKLVFKEGFESCEVVNNSDNSVIEVK